MNKATILVIDDQTMLLRVMQWMLSDNYLMKTRPTRFVEALTRGYLMELDKMRAAAKSLVDLNVSQGSFCHHLHRLF